MPIAQANSIDIWYETFGSRENESVLLIMGGCCQGILWPTDFCWQLAEAGFFVIRYDHRDTGWSSCFDFAKNPYNLNDMALDAIGLLDFLEIQQAHLIGLSMGGPIAELLAVHYPDRIPSCTLIATSCDFRPMNLAYAELPPEENSLSRTKDIYLEWIKKFKVDFPKNEEEHIEFRLEGWKILSGDKVPFEEELYRKIHKEFLQRVKRPESMVNHIEVCRVSEEIVRNIPAMVQVPTLVLHGTEDPIVPPDHGQALAALIKNSKYVLVEGMGHVPNKYFYQLIIDNVSNFKKNHLDSTHFK